MGDEAGRVLEVAYGEAWDPVARAVVGPLCRDTARARDTAGEQYAVVLREPGRPQPEAVLHVAGAQGFLGVWHYDAYGRRTREGDLRRLEPDRLFLRHVSEWDYPTPETEEFGEEAGRTTTELEPGGGGHQRLEPEGPHGPRTDVPARIPEHERWWPVPEFGAWAGLLGATRPGGPREALRLTLHDVPDPDPADRAPAGGGVAPGWAPPCVTPPRGLEALFTPGSTFPDDTAPGSVRTVAPPLAAGDLHLPTGRVTACDPTWDEPVPGFTVSVAPGTYPVEVARLSHPPRGMGQRAITMVAAARLVISRAPTATWEMAVLPGQDARLLRAGTFYGFGVDGGTGCFVDASAAERLCARYWEALAEGLDEDGRAVFEETEDGITTMTEDGVNLIAYPSGYGDGAYPVWIGRDAGGGVTCFVADMCMVGDAPGRLPPS
ncbi:DUF4241 domain-containing protein [Streptomyces sp. 4N509B]|uniref:DUF4241 domain-containing protein n=1 Tax=Streptomyces sp. 4N509B TaxID=3457413 RepID=UPI003FD239EF